MPAAFSARPFDRFLWPTISGMIACRAGIMNDHIPPCSIEAASRWVQWTSPVAISTVTTRAMAAFSAWPPWMIFFLSTRSAIAPPHNDSRSMGIAEPPFTMPSSTGCFVRSYTR